VPHKYATVEGVATYVHHVGATTLPEVVPDLSRGEIVVCLHGSGGNGAVFAELLRALAAEHSPLALDLPGHGRSGGLDGLASIEQMAAFVAAFLDKWGIARAVWLGHSMGGAVALRAALERPERVRALVLCASGARFPGAAIPAVARVVAGKDRRPFFRDAYAPKAPPEVLRRGFLEDLKTDPRVLLSDLEACRAFDAEADLGRIAVPALVAVGEDEDPALRERSERLAAGLRGATFRRIRDAGHMLPLEQPEALAGVVSGFLRSLP
jgi:pimeloyl-ACP methyl ester carboxylesterase